MPPSLCTTLRSRCPSPGTRWPFLPSSNTNEIQPPWVRSTSAPRSPFWRLSTHRLPPAPPPPPAALRAPPGLPGLAPRTLLFTSMVPRQPLLAPCRWLRFMLSAGAAAASSGRAAPQERGQLVRGCGPGASSPAPAEGVAAARASALRSTRPAPAAPGPRVRLAARRAGTRLLPSLQPSLPPSGSRGRRRPRCRGRSGGHRRRGLALGHLPREPASARAPGAGQSLGACARSPAASEQPRPLALRPYPIGSAHLRPRRQPISIRLAQRMGGPSSLKPCPQQHDWFRAAREGRDHLKPWAFSPDPDGEPKSACVNLGVPPREDSATRLAGSASAPGERLGRVGLLRVRRSAPGCLIRPEARVA